MTTQNGIKRYSPSDRANHVLVAVLFILAAVSGLALFHPSMFFLTAVLGGGELSRVLHPFVGAKKSCRRWVVTTPDRRCFSG